MMALAFGLLGATALGQAPPTLMYQGKLTDANLDPITTTTAVIFTVWDVQDAGTGTALWAETTTVAPGAQGIFTIELGALNPIPDSVFDGRVRFLGMKVGTDTDELDPRQPITSVPYSMKADAPSFANTWSSWLGMTTTFESVDTLEVAVPGPGYVMVEATGVVYAYKTSASYSASLYVNLDTLASTTDYKAYFFRYWATTMPTWDYYNGLALRRVAYYNGPVIDTFFINTLAGTYLSASVQYTNLSAVYYPNHMGTVSPVPAASAVSAPQQPPTDPEESKKLDEYLRRNGY
ncbi:MAG: hypothetical protein JSW34_07200 [Candidatus Zixiibacteriota bacterium]|nr:MAG: hypothetical protein JSW34_07200 [candidate division Zixibacteria bacterium]